MAGTLYTVSTPIGNIKDITLRALEVLQNVDAVICEEYRQGSTILKKLGIDEKELILLNEHSQKGESSVIAKEIREGKRYALISDCGTPAFADPGTDLIRLCFEYGIQVIPVPGASSLMAAVSLSPISLGEFYYVGFLPRKTEIRTQKLIQLKKMCLPLIIMESPYRLTKLLAEISSVFAKDQLITLAYNLTMDEERIYHGSVSRILAKMKDKKGEFVLIVHQ